MPKTTDVAIIAGLNRLNTGQMLKALIIGRLVEKPDKKLGLWQITKKGRECVESPPELTQPPTEKVSPQESPGGAKGTERKHNNKTQGGGN